ncbi:MAG: hypothetical protein ACPG77_10925, partial [Nannocystaceae bacterium]
MARILEIERTVVPEVPTLKRARSGPPTSPPAADPRMDEVLELLRARGPTQPKAAAVLTLGELWERVGPGWM